MLRITAALDDGTEGALFLQNAETIHLVRPGGEPVSVVALARGDRILCRRDEAGRHFGIRITEDITEV
jgi:3-dehydroquinate synthase II